MTVKPNTDDENIKTVSIRSKVSRPRAPIEIVFTETNPGMAILPLAS